MTFGKPKQTKKQVRCLYCGEEYRDCDINLKHAGQIESGEHAGDYWNSECPECGVNNGMDEEYAEMSDERFREEQHKVARYRQEARNGAA